MQIPRDMHKPAFSTSDEAKFSIRLANIPQAVEKVILKRVSLL
jgi:hypothetical protein